jgi:hypothetical protein
LFLAGEPYKKGSWLRAPSVAGLFGEIVPLVHDGSYVDRRPLLMSGRRQVF